MLGALSFSHSHPRLQIVSANLSHGRERRPPFLRFSASLSNSNGRNSVFCKRVSLCSVSGGGYDPIQAGKVHAEVGEDGEEVDSKASSAIAPINPRPQDCLTVLALPLPHGPLFPGFYMPIFVKVSKIPMKQRSWLSWKLFAFFIALSSSTSYWKGTL